MNNCDRINFKKLSLVRWLAFISISLTISNNVTLAQSQIVPDQTLGNETSQVRSNGEVEGLPAELIEGGASRGTNLFHSFQEFNVGEGQLVDFANPAGIDNILTRITGSNISNILGTLGVNGSADLFLLNPNGIIFGENASLDINGSFVGTTGNAIQFGEQGFFSASDPESPALLTVNPSAFFFNQINPGAIQSQSIAPAGVDSDDNPLLGLRVPDGNNLLFLGGDIAIDGSGLQSGLHAIDGQVALLGVNQQGTVGFNADGVNLAFNFPQELESADISLNNGAFINTSGESGGAIRIQGRNITLSDQSLVFSDTFGSQDGRGISIKAQNLLLNNNSRVTTDVVGSGQGGELNIETEQLSIQNGSVISSSNFGQGNGGNININATETLSIDSSGVFSEVDSNAIGNAGDVNLFSKSLFLSNSSLISTNTFGQGNGGNININATETASIVEGASLNSNVVSNARGEAGNIAIKANDVVFDGGFARSRLEPGGEGSGGNIKITTGSLLVTGISPELTGNTGQLVTATFGKGDAGNLIVDATGDVVFDGRGSDVFSLTGGNLEIPIAPAEGDAGNIIINSGSLSVTNQARLVSNVEGVGNAGNININTNSLSITNEGQILSDVANTGIGDAGGNIEIVAESVDVTNRGRLSASTALTGNGGNVTLEIADLLLLSNNASISTTAGVEGAGGDGGNIEINADVILAFPLENNDITANAFEGNGGNIDIEAQAIFGIEERSSTPANQTNDIDASSQFGLSGTVKINILETDPSQDSLDIPVEPVEAKVAQTCERNISGNQSQSEFVVTGRGGLPPEPEDNFRLRAIARNEVAEPVTTLENGLKSETSAQQQPQVSPPIVEATRWIRNQEGKILLLASPSTASSLDSHSNSASCS